MDRTKVSKTLDLGSIPSGATIINLEMLFYLD